MKKFPKGVEPGTWVERIEARGNAAVTKGKKYKVLRYFRRLSDFWDKGKVTSKWEEFISLRNDDGYVVKMNLAGFKPCDGEIEKKAEEPSFLYENLRALVYRDNVSPKQRKLARKEYREVMEKIQAIRQVESDSSEICQSCGSRNCIC